MSKKPLISIVVPVYNVEKYVKRCIDSLLSQSYENIEIILVDDGATDNSGRICDQLASCNSSITVYHKKNGGLSEARNFGTKKAQGMYIAYIDSDDYVSHDYIDYLYSILERYHADISVCCGLKTEAECEKFNQKANFRDLTVLTGYDACVEYFRQPYHMSLVTAWGKLIKADIAKNNLFPIGKIHEDEATTCKFFYCSRKVVISNRMLYAYYQNPLSITHQSDNSINETLIWALKHRALYFEEKGEKELSKLAWNSVVSYLLEDNLLNCGRCRRIMKDVVNSKKITIRLKIHSIAYLYFERLYRKMRKH